MPPHQPTDQHLLDALEAPVAPGPVLLRRLFAVFLHLALVTAKVFPEQVFSWVGSMGQVASRLGLAGPSPDDVASVFGRITEAEAKQIAIGIGGLSFKNELLKRKIEKEGLSTVEPYLQKESIELLKTPCQGRGVLYICSHIGVMNGIMAAIHASGIPILIVRASGLPYAVRDGMILCGIQGAQGRHAFVLKRAVDHLKAGGNVAFSFDSTYGGSVLEGIPFMGRQATFRRGLAALIRLTGATVIPISARWASGGCRIELKRHPGLDGLSPAAGSPREVDRKIVARAASWLEKVIRDNPDQLQWHFLRQLLRYPPIPETRQE